MTHPHLADTPMLPLDMAQHPIVEGACPHCSTVFNFEPGLIYLNIYAERAKYTTSNPRSVYSQMERTTFRFECPICSGGILYRCVPVQHYRIEVEAEPAPDPLANFTPNSRVWERQKRGMPEPSKPESLNIAFPTISAEPSE